MQSCIVENAVSIVVCFHNIYNIQHTYIHTYIHTYWYIYCNQLLTLCTLNKVCHYIAFNNVTEANRTHVVCTRMTTVVELLSHVNESDQPFILSGGNKWVVNCNEIVATTIMVAPSGECLRGGKWVWCVYSEKALSSTPERFSSDAFHLGRYTNVQTLPLHKYYLH